MVTGIFSAFSPPDIQTGSETLIQTALSRLIKNKTVPVIAHRMRTVAGADKIVVLKNGVVAEQGSPDELYRRGGIYKHMVDLQSDRAASGKLNNAISVVKKPVSCFETGFLLVFFCLL